LKEKYRRFCREEALVPIFCMDWWLDAIAGENWGVCLIERNGRVIASLPYVYRRAYGMRYFYQPPLTQCLGPWIRELDAKEATKLANEIECLEGLMSQLPEFASFAQNWHFSQTNWLPFYWNGFRQSVKYTYRLEATQTPDSVWQCMRPNIRREIRKARQREKLTIVCDRRFDDFWKLNKHVFERQGLRTPYPKALVEAVEGKASQHACRRMFFAVDNKGCLHAAAFIVWDAHTAYYLMGGVDPLHRTSGAMSLCLWEAIKYSLSIGRNFDFEGSMIRSVERFFRGFGAVQVPYYRVWRGRSVRQKFNLMLRSMKRDES